MWSVAGALVVVGALCVGAHDARLWDARNSSLRVLTLGAGLEWVDASDNEIGSVEGEAPLLRALTLRNNRLHVLPALTLPRLAALDVSSNALRTLPTRLTLPALRALNVSCNSLASLPTQLLADAPHLLSVDASRNTLATLPNLGLRRLAYLLLSHNRLVRLDEAALNSVHVLRTLDLSHNALRRFPGAALRRAAYLGSVNVSDNRIRHLAQGDLDDVRVVALDLSGQLERVDAGAFRSLPLIVNLTLAHSSRLRFLPAGAFGDLPTLRQVDLSHNALVSFEQPPSWVMGRILLDAAANAFVCHCATAWLNASCDDTPTCAPLVLPLLPEEQLVSLGAHLELRCAALGARHVRWLRADAVVADDALLRMRHVGRADAGLWTCEASSALGSARRSVEVRVREPNVRVFALSVAASFVTLAWNMSGGLPYVLRWAERGVEADAGGVAGPFPAAPRAHSYTVHGLRPLTPYCFALRLHDVPEDDATLDQLCVTTLADLLVGVRRSYATAAALLLAGAASVAACVAVCAAGHNRRERSTLRRAELVRSADAAFVIELSD